MSPAGSNHHPESLPWPTAAKEERHQRALRRAARQPEPTTTNETAAAAAARSAVLSSRRRTTRSTAFRGTTIEKSSQRGTKRSSHQTARGDEPAATAATAPLRLPSGGASSKKIKTTSTTKRTAPLSHPLLPATAPAVAVVSDRSAPAASAGITSSVVRRSYNLRATMARQQHRLSSTDPNTTTTTTTTTACHTRAEAANTVTPAAPVVVRHINFEGRAVVTNTNTSTTTSTTTHPSRTAERGLVDLFDPQQVAWARRPGCWCPANVNLQQGTDLAWQYLAEYGHEAWQALLAKEASDMAQLYAQRRAVRHGTSSQTKADGTRRSRTYNKEEEEEESLPETPLPSAPSKSSKFLKGVGGSKSRHHADSDDDDGDDDDDDDEEDDDDEKDGDVDDDGGSGISAFCAHLDRMEERRDRYYDQDVDPDDDPEDEEEAEHSTGSQHTANSLTSGRPLPRQPLLTSQMRAILVNWLVEVATEYPISDNALHLAITLLDRILLQGPAEGAVVVEQYDENKEPFLIAPSEFQAVGWYVRSLPACLPAESESQKGCMDRQN